MPVPATTEIPAVPPLSELPLSQPAKAAATAKVETPRISLTAELMFSTVAESPDQFKRRGDELDGGFYISTMDSRAIWDRFRIKFRGKTQHFIGP